ncbi:MAG TPA: hypothetical protein PLD80_03415 [Rugosibacter sp.]|nr:hypothetical protein [Rugosibacter sp.]
METDEKCLQRRQRFRPGPPTAVSLAPTFRYDLFTMAYLITLAPVAGARVMDKVDMRKKPHSGLIHDIVLCHDCIPAMPIGLIGNRSD